MRNVDGLIFYVENDNIKIYDLDLEYMNKNT